MYIHVYSKFAWISWVPAEITEIYRAFYPKLFDERKANRKSFTMSNFSHASIWALKIVYLEIIVVHKDFGLFFYEYS